MYRLILIALIALSLSGCGLFMERQVERPRNYDWVQNMTDEQFNAMMADFNQSTQRDILHELQFQSLLQMMPLPQYQLK